MTDIFSSLFSMSLTTKYEVQRILDCRALLTTAPVDSHQSTMNTTAVRTAALRTAAGLVDGLEFKVQWLGYSDKECTWIRAENFAEGSASLMLIEFMQRRATIMAQPTTIKPMEVEDLEDDSPLSDHLPLSNLISNSPVGLMKSNTCDLEDDSPLCDHLPLSTLIPQSSSSSAAAAVELMGPPTMTPRFLRPRMQSSQSTVDKSSIPVNAHVSKSANMELSIDFLRNTFFIDYNLLHDPLRVTLKKLNADIVSAYPSDSNDDTCILVYMDGSSPQDTSLMRSAQTSRYASIIAASSSTHPMQDNRIVAKSRNRCISRSKLLAIALDQSRQVKRPRMIVRDIQGRYVPEIHDFPMVPVFKQTQVAAASGGKIQFEREMVHTLPQLDWNAPAGRSPFTKGGLPYVYSDASAAVAANAPNKMVSKRLQWCEWCRVNIENEQTVRDTLHFTDRTLIKLHLHT